jgi:N-methylhydantoinase A
MKRLAVDTGGTFTDIVYIDDETKQVIVDKVMTTPRDLVQGVIAAIKKIKIDLSEITLFIHGTTAGLNTIAQRTGSRVGLITTKGFTDILEMTRSSRKEVYDYLWKKPQPLVPRYLRRGVPERTSHTGEILEKLDGDQVKETVKYLEENKVESIAVCLLHSYANPTHELKIGEIVREVWPDVSVSLSHQVAMEIGENVRTNTTILSAYSGKAIVGYVSRLNEELKEMGFRGQLLILGSSGVLGIEAAREKPLSSLSSGPVGGAAGAAFLAGLCGYKNIVTMDVGGTSYDVSIIKDGVNLERHESELMGYPVFMAGIEIRSIGAGGGSIARVDAGGLLTVGPESAGANPGPMAYGLGGYEPTVTDAALVNGLIDPDYFLGGEIKLDLGRATAGIGEIAGKLGIGLNQAAEGILAIARNNMTTATVEILIGQGHDPRDFTLMAFGGGGGIFAGAIARDMSISKVIVPPDPGVFCARGILTMNLVHTYARSYARPLDRININELNAIYKDMEGQALKLLETEGMSARDVEYTRTVEMGYADQHYFIETPAPGGELKENARKQIGDAFESLHESRYGHRIQASLKISAVRLKATGKIKDIPVTGVEKGQKSPASALKKKRQVFLDGKLAATPVYERDRLACGNVIRGPVIIEEPFHTSVVMPGQTAEIDRLGNIIIHTGGA